MKTAWGIVILPLVLVLVTGSSFATAPTALDVPHAKNAEEIMKVIAQYKNTTGIGDIKGEDEKGLTCVLDSLACSTYCALDCIGECFSNVCYVLLNGSLFLTCECSVLTGLLATVLGLLGCNCYSC